MSDNWKSLVVIVTFFFVLTTFPEALAETTRQPDRKTVEVIENYVNHVSKITHGCDNRDEKLVKADELYTKAERVLIDADILTEVDGKRIDSFTILTSMSKLLNMARFLSNPKPSIIFTREDFKKARKEYDKQFRYLQGFYEPKAP